MSTLHRADYEAPLPVLPAAQAQDILAFANRVGLQPDPVQASVLQSNANRGILNCSRQWGKSTLAAALTVHRCLTRPESLVLFAAPSAPPSPSATATSGS